MKKREIKRKWTVIEILIFILLIEYTIFLVVPSVWSLISSIKTDYDFRHNLFGLPKTWEFENYLKSFFGFYIEVVEGAGSIRKVYMPEMFLNSLLYSTGCAFFATYIPCHTAYITAKYKNKFSSILTAVVIVCIALPIVGSLPSEIQVARSLGLYDKMIGMWVLKANFLSIYFLIFQNVFKNVPNAYIEAAKVDGASNLKIYLKIMLPLVSKVFLTVFLLNFIAFWNDYQTPLIFMPNVPTVAYGLYEFNAKTVSTFSSIPLKLAGTVLVVTPVFILFVIFQKRIMGNISIGGIK